MSLADYLQQLNVNEQTSLRQEVRKIREGSTSSIIRESSLSKPSLSPTRPLSLRDPSAIGRKIMPRQRSEDAVQVAPKYADDTQGRMLSNNADAQPSLDTIAAALRTTARDGPPRTPLAPALIKALGTITTPSARLREAALDRLLMDVDADFSARYNNASIGATLPSHNAPKSGVVQTNEMSDLPSPLRRFHVGASAAMSRVASDGNSPSPSPARSRSHFEFAASGADAIAGYHHQGYQQDPLLQTKAPFTQTQQRPMELSAEPSPSSSPMQRPSLPYVPTAKVSEGNQRIHSQFNEISTLNRTSTPSRSPTLSDATRREDSPPHEKKELAEKQGESQAAAVPRQNFTKALLTVPNISLMTAVGQSANDRYNSHAETSALGSPMRIFPARQFSDPAASELNYNSAAQLTSAEIDALHAAQGEAHRQRLTHARRLRSEGIGFDSAVWAAQGGELPQGENGVQKIRSVSDDLVGNEVGEGGGAMSSFASMSTGSYPTIQIPITAEDAKRGSPRRAVQRHHQNMLQSVISNRGSSRAKSRPTSPTTPIGRLRASSTASGGGGRGAMQRSHSITEEFSLATRQLSVPRIRSFLDPALFRTDTTTTNPELNATTSLGILYAGEANYLHSQHRTATNLSRPKALKLVNDFYTSNRADPNRIVLDSETAGNSRTILSHLAPTTRILYPEEKHAIVCAIEVVLEMGEFGHDGGGTWGGQLAAANSGGGNSDRNNNNRNENRIERGHLISQPSRYNVIGSSSSKAMWRLYVNWIEHMRGGSDVAFGNSFGHGSSLPTTPNRRRRSTTPTNTLRADSDATFPLSAPSTPHRLAYTSKSTYRTIGNTSLLATGNPSSRPQTPRAHANSTTNRRWFIKGIIPPKLVATVTEEDPIQYVSKAGLATMRPRSPSISSMNSSYRPKTPTGTATAQKLGPRYAPLKITLSHLRLVSTALSSRFTEWNSLAPGSLEFFVAITCLDFLTNGYKQHWRPKAVLLRGDEHAETGHTITEPNTARSATMADAKVLTISRRLMANVLDVLFEVDQRED